MRFLHNGCRTRAVSRIGVRTWSVPVHSTRTLDALYRPLRPVTTGVDAPYPGLLCRTGDDRAVVRVDVATLPLDWPGWRAEQDGHVLAPLDVARRDAGHDVLLPAFAGRIDDVLGDDLARLQPGEAVTLAVSLIRGRLAVDDPTASGQWWLTDDGRPVLATHVGSTSVATATVDLLTLLSQGRPGSAWRDAPLALGDAEISQRRAWALEEALFAIADPTAIGLHRRSTPRTAAAETSDAVRHGAVAAAEAPETGLWTRLARHLDADLADSASQIAFEAWRRVSTPKQASRRRTPWLVAAGLAVAIVTGGLFWPAGGPATATGGTPTAPASPAPSDPPMATDTGVDSGKPDGEVVTDPSAPEDLIAVTGDLLSARVACDADPGCLGAVQIDAAVAHPAGAADLTPEARTITLLDDFGGVAVLRVEGPGADAQLIVIERKNEKWLLREVYLAQQP